MFIGLRAYHLEQVPEHGATMDEFAWTWSGMSLLQTGSPRAWSNLAAYKGRRHRVEWRGQKYNIVEPWLDHPPVYSLYAGGWVLLHGQREMFQVDLRQMRMGSLVLDALGFVLFSLVLRRLVTRGELMLSLLFYSVIPLIVFHQRLVISENLIVPLTLGAVLSLQAQSRRFSWWRALWLLVLAALLPLTKVAALSSCVFLVLWALVSGQARTRWITTGALVIGTCVGVGAYLGYARHLDAELATAVLTNHHDRFKGFAGMELLLFQPKFIAKPTRELWTVLGSVLALLSLSLPRVTPWGLAVLVYSACMAFFVDETRVYGWYYMPLYPWLCAALGVAIVHASRRHLLGLSLLWCTVAWLGIARLSYVQQLLTADHARFGYLLGLLTLYGALCAWPRFARSTLPALNGLMVAGAVAACVAEVYLR